MKNVMSILFLSGVLVASLRAQTPTPAPAAKKITGTAATKTGTHAVHKPAAAAAPAQTWPTENGLYSAFDTTQGRIVAKLYEKESPITVRNFTMLARGLRESVNPKTHAKVKRPFYDGLTFHRVIPEFMIQGGDPTGTGAGDGGIPAIADEFDPSLKFDQKGRLAMANAGPHTGSCQFFITDSTPAHLNGKHTIFGQVVEGQDIVTKIANLPRNPNDKPNTPVIMTHVYIHRVGSDPNSPTARTAVHTTAKHPITKKPAVPAAKQ